MNHDEEWEPDTGLPLDEDASRWPPGWRDLLPRERWLWFLQLWQDVRTLERRYRLAVPSGWCEDDVQVEALAALAAWTRRYDSGECDDPPGKLQLLYDLARVRRLLGPDRERFDPDRDRPAFARYLAKLDCQPPPQRALP